MLTLDAQAVAGALPYDQLIAALDAAFQSDLVVPERIHHDVAVPGGNSGSLLMMPAWRAGRKIGVKVVTIFPDNSAEGLPPVHATYLVLDARTGVPLAQLDGGELTLRRTGAASALASTYLSREDSRVLLMVGSGSLAPHLIAAHATVRGIDRVMIWGRRRATAEALAARFNDAPWTTEVVGDLQPAVERADIVSCATLATEPLVRGEWLHPGQHLDLVGAFKPGMQEADSAALSCAVVYVDTYAGALAESGEIVAALQNGAIAQSDIVAELSELTRKQKPGRQAADAITLFKSVGTALEDLAAAALAIRNHNG